MTTRSMLPQPSQSPCRHLLALEPLRLSRFAPAWSHWYSEDSTWVFSVHPAKLWSLQDRESQALVWGMKHCFRTKDNKFRTLHDMRGDMPCLQGGKAPINWNHHYCIIVGLRISSSISVSCPHQLRQWRMWLSGRIKGKWMKRKAYFLELGSLRSRVTSQKRVKLFLCIWLKFGLGILLLEWRAWDKSAYTWTKLCTTYTDAGRTFFYLKIFWCKGNRKSFASYPKGD